MSHYEAHLDKMKKSSKKIFKSMQKTLGTRKADFKYKTTSILWTWLCWRDWRSRDYLRKTSPSTRQELYFQKGNEKLGKEMDLAFIVRHIRILRYFLKTVLDKD